MSVDGGQNSPGTDPNADGEVMLDIEVVGAVAPGRPIVVYFAPNTDQGFIDAVSTAVHDTTHKPSVVSISWGESEDAWSAQARTQMEQILTEAGGLGVTVTRGRRRQRLRRRASATAQQHTDFPASAPHALGCGGTSLQASGATIQSETVWNDPGDGATGGGVSRQFPLPGLPVQAPACRSTSTPRRAGRGVPDVSGNADPQTGYRIRVDGAEQVDRRDERGGAAVGGADRAAQRAARLARSGSRSRLCTRCSGTDSFHDITSGDNGSYAAGPGWDACTGLGSPDGTALAAALQALGRGRPARDAGGRNDAARVWSSHMMRRSWRM